jgi:hypothetical protein
MTGRKRLFAVSLLLLALAPASVPAADVKAQSSTQSLWYTAQLPYDALDESGDGVLSGSVPFSGKAAFT